MALLPLLLVLVLAVAVVVGAGVVRRSPASLESTVVAARRHARGTATVAVLVGVATAVATAATGGSAGNRAGGLGVTVIEVVLAFGIAHTVAVTVGELTWPRPEGAVRRARLVRRGALDAAPRWLARLAAGALATAVLTAVVGGLTAAPDGRSVSHSTTTAQGLQTATAGPFPGWFYGRPALLGVLLLTAVALLALQVVATRPAVVTADDRVEDALRRASAHRVLRAAAGSTLVATGGLLSVGGHALWSVTSAHGAGVLGTLGVVVAGCGLAGMLAGVVVACVRAPEVPADAPAVPAG